MKNFLTQIYRDFQTKEESWCEIAQSQFVFNGMRNKIYGGYEKEHFQQFYLLKYAPLYFEEYIEMYEKFLKVYTKNTLRVLSVGVGAGLDYYGLTVALSAKNNIEMEYLGIDLIDWKYRDEEINFEQTDFKDIANNEKVMNFIRDGVDVIIFPKSIIEIPSMLNFTSDTKVSDAFSNLCSILIENKIDDIWFLNSYIKSGNKISGIEKFKIILDILIQADYSLVNGLDDAHYYNSNQRSVNYPIDYKETWQQDLNSYCHKKCGKIQSDECRLAQNPMLNKSHIAFGITNFKKVA